MDTGQGPSLSKDGATSLDIMSTYDPQVTTQDVSDVPHEELPQLHGSTGSPAQVTENTSVPQGMHGDTSEVEVNVEAQANTINAINSSESGNAPDCNETNGHASNGRENGKVYQPSTRVHFSGDAEEGNDNQPEESPHAGISMGEKKKKKKKKPKSQRGLNAPTGFEEYYVDAPLTPEEFAEEQDLYDMSNPFVVRIETAIQRYRARRNMNSDKKNLFDKWLTFGGIDSSPRQFTGGLDPQLLADSTAREIAAMTAVNFVNNDMDFEGPNAKYEVDFDGVVKSFLSSRLDKQFDTSTKDKIEGYCNIIRNFMNYLLHHDVCPEYQDQIFAARDSCTLATKQLWNCHEVITMLPGDFGKACSTLFGGFYYNTYNAEAQLAPGSETSMFGMSNDRARHVFEFGLTAHCDEQLFERYQTQVAANIVSMESLGELGLEVIAIEMPSEEIQNLYANLPKLEPSGVLRAKSWKVPGTEASRDLSPEERIAEKRVKEVIKEYEFWIEESVLKKLFIGMKLRATVLKMSFGVLYMDNCLDAFCSFFEILPNELILGYRPFRYLEPRVKEVYNEEQDEQAPNGGDGKTGDEMYGGEHEQTAHTEPSDEDALIGNERDQTASQEGAETHNTSSTENHDAAPKPSEPPQKWHYEEIDGALCFVPYTEPTLNEFSDYDDDDDDDDERYTLVNARTNATAHDGWPTYTGPILDDPHGTQIRALNPDTDPYTMKLDTWAKPVNPDSDSDLGAEAADDGESRLGEHVAHKSGVTIDTPQTPEKTAVAYGSGDTGASAEGGEGGGGHVQDDEDIDISPSTEKMSARVPLSEEVDFGNEVEEVVKGKLGKLSVGEEGGKGDDDDDDDGGPVVGITKEDGKENAGAAAASVAVLAAAWHSDLDEEDVQLHLRG